MINLLNRDYHVKQADMRLNYLAKTFGAWYVALEMLGTSLDHIKDDEHTMREYVFDSLADMYAKLTENDMFYGTWRHRCLHLDTNIALAFEQNDMWEQASNAYEVAQNKARASTIPFSEAEFCLREDHWILAELAKSDGNQGECAWRTTQWVNHFEAFIALLKLPATLDKNIEFTEILEDAMQLSLRKWVALPPQLSAAHIPLLQHFQQFVELQEAVQIFGSLSTTTAQNLKKKIFRPEDDGSTANNTQTFGYHGYHETAWIINRFAHKPKDLQAGLEVINNTNLVFFSVAQKAEFYTLKGMFHARFKRNEEANNAFGQVWGRFNDNISREVPNDLLLLSVDDNTLAISRAFDTYKGDAAYWFWITFIPHLCMSLSNREVKQAHYVLLNLARHYPQRSAPGNTTHGAAKGAYPRQT
ncbi:hypothetical protein DFH06DRAFT_1439353 [Mycena polygramma]|nr:hypothetical protein DFH06DRAFT_1439353 [Mycena polygramma]